MPLATSMPWPMKGIDEDEAQCTAKKPPRDARNGLPAWTLKTKDGV